jgi:hypothetical protein
MGSHNARRRSGLGEMGDVEAQIGASRVGVNVDDGQAGVPADQPPLFDTTSWLA